MLDALRFWPRRRWIAAALIAAVGAVVIAVPTDLIDTPWFRRDVAPAWWSWPALAFSTALGGLLAATYVKDRRPGSRSSGSAEASAARRGSVAGILTFFAVGCPVCNKLVLLALGYAGAMTWFQPVQPVLQVAAIGLLLWALRTRLAGEIACPARPGPGGAA